MTDTHGVGSSGGRSDSDDRSSHRALVYESREEQLSAIASFVRAGLERNDRCVIALHDASRGAVTDALADGGIDPTDAIDAGRLELLDATDVHLEDGAFDPEGTIDTLEAMVEDTRSDDAHAGLRLTAETSWLPDCDVSVGTFLECASAADRRFDDREFTGLWQYDRRQFSDEAVAGVLRSDPRRAAASGVAPDDRRRQSDAFSPEATGRDVDPTGRSSGATARTRGRATALREALERLTDPALAADGDPIRVAVGLLEDVLSPRAIGGWRYCRSDDELRLRTASGDGVDRRTVEALAGPAWRAFVAGTTVETDVSAPPLASTGVGSALSVPVGSYGVLVVCSRRAAGIDGDAAVADAVAGWTEIALERSRIRRRLEEREALLERERERRQRLARYDAVRRRIERAVVRCATAAKLQEAVCAAVASLDSVRLAWIGRRSEAGDGLTPEAWSGTGRDYLDGVDLGPADGGESRPEPAVQADRSGEPESVPDVVEHLHRDPWRSEALDRGFNAVVSVPIAYEDTVYGVLSLYAGESEAFPDRPRSALAELGELVGYALNAIERKRALLTDRTVELEFEIRDERCPALRLARRADCSLDLRGTVPKSADRTLAFFAVPNGAAGRIEAAAAESIAVADAHTVGSTGGGRVVRLEMERPFLATVLADHGAVLSELSADAGVATASVEFPSSTPARTIADVVTAAAPDSTLVAKRTSPRPAGVDRSDGSLRDELTERQAEVLRTAHHHGFFDRPRRNDGGAVADALDISPQTFHQHRRAAIGRIADAMFDDPRDDGPS